MLLKSVDIRDDPGIYGQIALLHQAGEGAPDGALGNIQDLLCLLCGDLGIFAHPVHSLKKQGFLLRRSVVRECRINETSFKGIQHIGNKGAEIQKSILKKSYKIQS